MSIEAIADPGSQPVPAAGGTGPLHSLPELERSFAAVRQQVEELVRQRDQLAQTVQKLEADLAAQREAGKQLAADRDKYRELMRVYIEIADPIENVIRDFENMPPLEQMSTSEEFLAELEALHGKLKEQKSA